MPVKVNVYTLGEIFQLAQKEADSHGKTGTVDNISIGVGEDKITYLYVDYEVRAESDSDRALLKACAEEGCEFIRFRGVLRLQPPNKTEQQRKP